MMLAGLVLGLLDTSRAIGEPKAAETYRSSTITWSRYSYQGEIIERDSVDRLLQAATAADYRYCLIVPYGCVFAERWQLAGASHGDFFAALAAWVESHEFFLAGRIAHTRDAWYGLEPEYLLVDLQQYERLGAPALDLECEGPCTLPKPDAVWIDGRVSALLPTGQTERQRPGLWGWNAIRAALEAGCTIEEFDDELRAHTLDLEAADPARRAALRPYLGDGIAQFTPGGAACCGLSADQQTFLEQLKSQTANARRGVFLWNIESYADIETPRDDFQGPVSSLYSVAAGFKPNRVLETHRFDAQTRVVFFDYSQAALDVRRFLVEHWDGVDFPSFARRVFAQFPPPGTFYQLWDNARAETLSRRELDLVWQRELARWGGEAALRDHWQAYARLKHEYICCDLLTDPSPLLARIADEPNAIIWWSNAFFTMYGNWYFSVAERKQAYDAWAAKLAAANPQLYLFGSDFNNTNVNSIQAAEYWDQYRRRGGDSLSPCRLYATELRM